jgi:hypothetical protein
VKEEKAAQRFMAQKPMETAQLEDRKEDALITFRWMS